MSQRILNLTLPVVSAKVDEILRDDGWEGTLDFLAIRDLRDRLTTYVVRRLPAIYVTLESEEVTALKDVTHATSYYPEERLAEIEQLIRQGLLTLMAVQASCPTTPVEVGEDVSCWFG